MSDEKKHIAVTMSEEISEQLDKSNSKELGNTEYNNLIAKHFGITPEEAKRVNDANKQTMTALAIVAGNQMATAAMASDDPLSVPSQQFSFGPFSATGSVVMAGPPGSTEPKQPTITARVSAPGYSKSVVRTALQPLQEALRAACAATS